MVEVALAAVLFIGGASGVGVAAAWLNDRRLAAQARRLPPPDPKQVLEARFAAGDIDEREFHRRMHALVYGPPLELEADAGD